MSALGGGIASLFGTVFGSIYLDGTLGKRSYSDTNGSLTPSTTTSAIKVQVDECTEQQKAEEGYKATDVRLLILQAGATRPTLGDRVTVKGVTYAVGPTVSEDPAASYWECRGMVV